MDRHEKIRGALQVVIDPPTGATLADWIADIQTPAPGEAIVILAVDAARASVLEPLRQQAERAIAALAGLRKATVILSAERKTPDPHSMNKNPPLTLPIKHIIAVASGKGGVGKSTVSVNLAVALAQAGHKVGLLDADIYGPSIPKMMGLEGQKPERDNEDKIIPLRAHGVAVMSIGFLMDTDQALIWRGPMVQTAVYQLLRDVAWEGCDILIIDLPPGTGDAQLTLAQKVALTGAMIVSTPQDIALIDARKAVLMFQKLNVAILGIIENMSFYHCPACGHRDDVFGHGGAQAEAQKIGVPFLGAVPLNAAIRKEGDAGQPDTTHFREIADLVARAI